MGLFDNLDLGGVLKGKGRLDRRRQRRCLHLTQGDRRIVTGGEADA